ncbi:MAG: hypothetical protein P8P74_17685 [Crocinitomicaceae bacterium]|nr:hypothetical protein [Crocinitomicaceae bacterium]
MELLKSKTILNHISAFRKEDFAMNSPYLWIWNPRAVPPHMGLSIDGCYFSLKANGLDFNSDLQDLIGVISRKRLPVLAVELNLELTKDNFKSEFSKFERTIANEVTCLNPIKNVLNFSEVRKLSELLTNLDENDLLGKITSWNIEDSTIELADYSTEDIHKHLVSLTK